MFHVARVLVIVLLMSGNAVAEVLVDLKDAVGDTMIQPQGSQALGIPAPFPGLDLQSFSVEEEPDLLRFVWRVDTLEPSFEVLPATYAVDFDIEGSEWRLFVGTEATPQFQELRTVYYARLSSRTGDVPGQEFPVVFDVEAAPITVEIPRASFGDHSVGQGSTISNIWADVHSASPGLTDETRAFVGDQVPESPFPDKTTMRQGPVDNGARVSASTAFHSSNGEARDPGRSCARIQEAPLVRGHRRF